MGCSTPICLDLNSAPTVLHTHTAPTSLQSQFDSQSFVSLTQGRQVAEKAKRGNLLSQFAYLLVQDAIQKTFCPFSRQDSIASVCVTTLLVTASTLPSKQEAQHTDLCRYQQQPSLRQSHHRSDNHATDLRSAHRFTALANLGLGARPIDSEGCGRRYVTNSSSSSRMSSNLNVSAYSCFPSKGSSCFRGPRPSGELPCCFEGA